MTDYSTILNPYNNKLVKTNSKVEIAVLQKFLKARGGTKCSTCGAAGTNKASCPHNPDIDTSKHKPKKHNKNPIVVTKKITSKKAKKTKAKICEKADNKLREDKRVNFIVESINDPNSDLGKRLRASYAETNPGALEIQSVSNNDCGGCSAHYDFTILNKKGETLKCEEKGTENKCIT